MVPTFTAKTLKFWPNQDRGEDSWLKCDKIDYQLNQDAPCNATVWSGDGEGTQCVLTGPRDYLGWQWRTHGCPNDHASSISVQGSGCTAILFQHGDLTGVECVVPEGSWSTQQLTGDLGCVENSASSARLLQDYQPPQKNSTCKVTLWGGDHEQWSCVLSTGRFHVGELQNSGCFNNDVSSIKVEGTNCVAVLFDGGNFDGKECEVSEGDFMTNQFTNAFGCEVITLSFVLCCASWGGNCRSPLLTCVLLCFKLLG